MLDFINERPTVPADIEAKKMAEVVSILKPHLDSIPEDKRAAAIPVLKNWYYKNLLKQPGKSVGIDAGQSKGERMTQSSLNNFHSAGLDTGSTSVIDSLQMIINAPKAKKNEVRSYYQASLRLVTRPKSMKEAKDLTIHHLDRVDMKRLIKKIEYKPYLNGLGEDANDLFFSGGAQRDMKYARFDLDLEMIFSYRITRSQLIEVLEDTYCVPFSTLDQDAVVYPVYLPYTDSVFEFIVKVREQLIVGIDGVDSFVYVKDDDDEWYVECMCYSLSSFLPYTHIFDFNRVTCWSVQDMQATYGILVAYECIVRSCRSLMNNIDDIHFKVLAMRMTRSGFTEPLTRYTMRSAPSPLAKASFEESFETLLKAAKYKEVERFKSVSSTVIAGKMPSLGTYKCEILVDPSFYV